MGPLVRQECSLANMHVLHCGCCCPVTASNLPSVLVAIGFARSSQSIYPFCCLLCVPSPALSPLAPGANDIDQLARLQQLLGSITLEEWPGAAQLPDWHKITFGRCDGQPLDQVLPRAHPKARQLLQKMLR